MCQLAMTERTPLICEACESKLFIDPFSTCPRCASSVGPNLVLDDGCPSCREVALYFRQAYRAGPYDGLLREVVLKMKHPRGIDLAEVVAELWAAHLAGRLRNHAIDAVVPIPLHWLRRLRRGYNQSETLATALAAKLRVPCWKHALLRVRSTTPQSQLYPPSKRWENIKEVFSVSSRHSFEGKSVALVDDVYTTGATLSQAAKMLLRHKAKEVVAVVLAHGH